MLSGILYQLPEGGEFSIVLNISDQSFLRKYLTTKNLTILVRKLYHGCLVVEVMGYIHLKWINHLSVKLLVLNEFKQIN